MSKKNRAVAIIITAILFLIVGLVGGYFIGRNTSEMNRVVSSTDSQERYPDYQQSTAVASEEVLQADEDAYAEYQNEADAAATASTASTASTSSEAENTVVEGSTE